jgi:hypothetical protein
MSFFQSQKSKTAICLVDASGSTRSEFIAGTTVFNQMAKILYDLEYPSYRIIFWNNDKGTVNNFVNGVDVIPFVIDKTNLSLLFKTKFEKITTACLTFPHLGFTNIKEEWLQDDPEIILVTDGQIGYNKITARDMTILKQKLVNEIRKVNKLSIISVDKSENNLYDVEHVASAVGNDIYKLVMDNNLTNIVNKFISHTPNKKYVHINKMVPPAGFLPYTDKYFSEKNMTEFIQYIRNEINETKSDMDCLTIAQNLSTTLYYLTKGNSPKLMQSRVELFGSLFKNKLDINFVNYILMESIENERTGKAQIIADYRNNLKNLYAESQKMLLANTKNAIGFVDKFITLPFGSKNNYSIMYGSSRDIDGGIRINNQNFPNSTVLGIPILPVSYTNEQCVRQWVRQVISLHYHIDPLSDYALYTFISLAWIVSNFNVEKITNAYKGLVLTMLRKKRPNSNETDLDRIENGYLPTTSAGDFNKFLDVLVKVIKVLELDILPETLWYNICHMMGFEKQIKHFPNEKVVQLEVAAKVIEVPDLNINYSCIICLEDYNDAANSSGFKILPHYFSKDYNCEPNFLICSYCIDDFINSDNCACPICFNRLNKKYFEQVSSKVKFELPDIFLNYIKECLANKEILLGQRPSNKSRAIEPNIVTTGNLVFTRGTVGAGKTTYSRKLEKYLLDQKVPVIIQCPDMYRKNGTGVKATARGIKRSLERFIKTYEKNSNKTIIIDTCGESTNITNVFGVNLSGWNVHEVYPNWDDSDPKGYFMWSLQNVLNRKSPNKEDQFWLNPLDAGAETCRKVHDTKFKNVFKLEPYQMEDFNLAAEYAKKIKEPSFDFLKL